MSSVVDSVHERLPLHIVPLPILKAVSSYRNVALTATDFILHQMVNADPQYCTKRMVVVPSFQHQKLMTIFWLSERYQLSLPRFQTSHMIFLIIGVPCLVTDVRFSRRG